MGCPLLDITLLPYRYIGETILFLVVSSDIRRNTRLGSLLRPYYGPLVYTLMWRTCVEVYA